MSVTPQAGGMFNSYKVKYSPETRELLKVLMDEVKLTTAQRQQVNESLKKGEPLPVVRRMRSRPSHVDENLFDLKKNYYFLRRSQDQIVHSGAYEKERYRFLERTVDLEKEKERLRQIMEHGKSRPAEKAAKKTATGKPTATKITPEERLEELVVEVEDRLTFLREMEVLGQAKRFDSVIRQEIAAKLREMRKLDKGLADKYSAVVADARRSPGIFTPAGSSPRK